MDPSRFNQKAQIIILHNKTCIKENMFSPDSDIQLLYIIDFK